MKPPTEENSMKTSQSMTSLPPPNESYGGSAELARLRIERPYNSLKVRFYYITLLSPIFVIIL